MIDPGTDEENHHLTIRRFAAEVAHFIWKCCGVLLLNDSVHVDVAFPTNRLSVGVKCLVDQSGYSWYEGETTSQEEQCTLYDCSEAEPSYDCKVVAKKLDYGQSSVMNNRGLDDIYTYCQTRTCASEGI